MGKEHQHKKRSTDKENYTDFQIVRSIQTVILVAIVLATLFTLWNPFKIFDTKSTSTFLQVTQPIQAELGHSSTKPIIGILVGQKGSGSGFVCDDGLVEADVNEAIANMVKTKLENLGYAVYVLPENAMELINFQGFAFVALFCGSCEDTAENSSGFVVVSSLKNQVIDATNTLAACMGEQYQLETGIPFTYQILANDHHVSSIFASLNSHTPAVYIEMGSLLHDRGILVESASSVSEGISKGIRCYYTATAGAQ